MSRRAVLLAGVLLLASGWLLAQIPAEERVPVRDPDRLQALGFARDATNVYVWSKADLKGGPALDQKATATPETWGTATGYTTIRGFEFQNAKEDWITLWKDLDGVTCADNSSFDDFSPPTAYAEIDAPDGVTLKFLTFWAFDSDPERDISFRAYETCQPTGVNPPVSTLVAETQTFGAIGDYSIFASLHDLTVNKESCSYSVQVQLAPSADGKCGDFTRFAQKVRVSWLRAVSPAPATATFTDVPTNHPFFQFVEALVKSGITGGCGGGNFCPDASLTRGQMAVFLAKALGLQWP